MKVLLGVTGSVAAIMTVKMTEALLAAGTEVKIVATKNAFHFWDPKRKEADFVKVPVLEDHNEWPKKNFERGMPVAHIDLRDWADILLIAPLTANTLGKMANGLADNLLTCIIRAWPTTKPLILAPAMNTEMWCHPATSHQLNTLKSWYPDLKIIRPISKTLICGQTGIGAMANIDDIVLIVMENLKNKDSSTPQAKKTRGCK